MGERAIAVRRAAIADVHAVHEVLHAAFDPLRDQYTVAAFDATVLDPERVAARLSEGPVWVAEREAETVGTFGSRHDEGGCYLRGMGVLPAARGLGVGRLLLDEAVRYSQAVAAPRIWLYTTPFLDAAIHLYESVGFARMVEDPAPDFFGTPLIGMELPT